MIPAAHVSAADAASIRENNPWERNHLVRTPTFWVEVNAFSIKREGNLDIRMFRLFPNLAHVDNKVVR
jgi:hypothetical protein